MVVVGSPWVSVQAVYQRILLFHSWQEEEQQYSPLDRSASYEGTRTAAAKELLAAGGERGERGSDAALPIVAQFVHSARYSLGRASQNPTTEQEGQGQAPRVVYMTAPQLLSFLKFALLYDPHFQIRKDVSSASFSFSPLSSSRPLSVAAPPPCVLPLGKGFRQPAIFGILQVGTR